MFTTRWQPLGETLWQMGRLQSEMNRLFDRYSTSENARYAPSYPGLVAWEDGERLYVEAELPGMKLEDLEIYVTGGNQLIVKGTREAPEVSGGTWHRQERGFGSFGRTVTLPFDVDVGKVEARLVQGVLTVQLPKSERDKPRRITVKA